MSTSNEHQPEHEQPIKLTVSSTADLLAAVPYVLGYQPTDSVVVCAIADARIISAARVDLPTPALDGLAEADGDAANRLIEALARWVIDAGADAICVFGYGPAAAVNPVAAAARTAFPAHQLELVDLVRVTDGHYFSYLDPHPADGIPFDPSTSRVQFAAVLAGAVAFASRDELVATIAPVTGAQREAMNRATTTVVQRLQALKNTAGDHGLIIAGREALADAFTRYGSGGRLDDDEMASLIAHLFHPLIRNLAWLRTGTHAWQQQLWTDTTRRADPELAAPPASLLAFVAWRRGHTVLATAAVQRALDAEPEHPFAILIHRIITAGLPPSVFDGWPPVPPLDNLDNDHSPRQRGDN
jgi:hypothetical protein